MLEPATYDDIAWDDVRHLAMVLFLQNDGRVVLVRDGDRLTITSGAVRDGEGAYIRTSVRLPLEHAGFRRQYGYTFAADDTVVAMWVDGYRYDGEAAHRTDAEWWVGDADAAT